MGLRVDPALPEEISTWYRPHACATRKSRILDTVGYEIRRRTLRDVLLMVTVGDYSGRGEISFFFSFRPPSLLFFLINILRARLGRFFLQPLGFEVPFFATIQLKSLEWVRFTGQKNWRSYDVSLGHKKIWPLKSSRDAPGFSDPYVRRDRLKPRNNPGSCIFDRAASALQKAATPRRSPSFFLARFLFMLDCECACGCFNTRNRASWPD